MVLWAVVLLAIFAPHRMVSGFSLLLIVLLLGVAGLWEMYGLAARTGLPCFRWSGVWAGIVLLGGTFALMSEIFFEPPDIERAGDFASGVLAVFILWLLCRQFVSKSNTKAIGAIAATVLGFLYVPWLLNFIQKIYFFPGVQGQHYVLFFILVTKFSDLGAYVTGSLIGRHKMIPRISPGKTWEGFAGAIVISTGVSVGYALLAGDRLAGMTLFHAVILGVLLSGSAVVGDLIESIFKREAGVKDSGRLFPGIGGILDLLDSLLFNAPIMYLYLRFVLL